MRKIFYTILCTLFFFFGIEAQEFNAKISINSAKIQGTNKQIFATLEEQLRTFINERKWTNNEFSPNEKIECSFTIIINEMPSSNSFKAELQVQSRRPVFNAAYTTPLLNFRDRDFNFEYIEYQPLEFEPNNITDNLTAAISFYVYFLLGLDFDSMAPMGGSPYFQQMLTIVNAVQTQNWGGWESYGSERNRFAIATAFTEASLEMYRKMWYRYHRQGLDVLASNAEKGRKVIYACVEKIQEVYSRQPRSILITLFGDGKLDELTNVLTEATRDEKKKAHDILREIYPTRTKELDKLNR